MSEITTGALYQEWVDINSKLLTQINKQDEIISKQQALIDRLDQPIDTQLTGSRSEIVFSRSVRTASAARSVKVPAGVNNVLVSLLVHSLTGDVTGGGVALRVINGISNPGLAASFRLSDVTTNRSNQRNNHIVNISGRPISNTINKELKETIDPLGDTMGLYINIEGVFQSDEGVDCELVVVWF